MDMIYDGTVHLAMNGMRSVGSVSGDVTGVKRLPSYQEWSCSSTATSVLINMVGSCLAKTNSQRWLYCSCSVSGYLDLNQVRLHHVFWVALQCKGVDMHVVWLTPDIDARNKKIRIACFHKTRREFAHLSVWIGCDFRVFWCHLQ